MGAPESPVRVLVIDDEEQIRRALKAVLAVRTFDVTLAETGQAGLDAAVDCSPDLVILDLSLPDIDGLDVCRQLREWLTAPVLVLSVRADDSDKIAALDLGADDYLTKPFSTGELLARVRALLRRASQGETMSPVIEAGDIHVDLSMRTVTVGGEDVSLTRTEFAILAFLARNADHVVTSRMILKHVWGPEYGGPEYGGPEYDEVAAFADETQALRVHVSHLRKKVERNPALPRYIITEPGVGFRLSTK
jgi:two-component system KDP operon response regulator KdpE